MAPVIALSIASFSLSYNPVCLIVRCALSLKIQSFEANFLYCALYTGAPYSPENTVFTITNDNFNNMCKQNHFCMNCINKYRNLYLKLCLL